MDRVALQANTRETTQDHSLKMERAHVLLSQNMIIHFLYYTGWKPNLQVTRGLRLPTTGRKHHGTTS